MLKKKISDCVQQKNLYFYEDMARSKGHKIICGVDEAGRGPLAGPVFAAAVILQETFPSSLGGIKDSKKLTPKKRDEFYEKIVNVALDYAVASVSEKIIDKINILQATLLCMKKAISKLSIRPDFIMVDGNKAPDICTSTQTIIKGDNLSASIAAASIIAKVLRDKYMIKIARLYPQYDFQKNKGYGTISHVLALKDKGPCCLHRLSFLKKVLG